MRHILQYLERVAQAAHASLMRNFHCLSCCRQISPRRSLPDACGFDDRSLERLERPSSDESSHQTLFSSFLFGPANCFILRLTPTPCFSLTSSLSLSLCFDLLSMCVHYRVRFLSPLRSLPLSLFLSLPPCLPSVSFLLSCFVRKERLSSSTEGQSLVQSLSPCKQVLDERQQQTLRHVTGNLHLAQKNETT